MSKGFNVSEFSSNINQNGLMKPSKFLVRIPFPIGMRDHPALIGTSRFIELWCDSANIPGISIATTDVNRYGYGGIEKKPYMAINNDVNMTFLSDANGAIWTFFQQWARMIVNYDMRNGIRGSSGVNNGVLPGQKPFELAYKYEYVSDIEVIVFSEQTNKPSLEIVLRESFPTFVGDVQLNWADTSSFSRIPITFSVYDWHNRSVKFNNTTPTQETQGDSFNHRSYALGASSLKQTQAEFPINFSPKSTS